MTQIDDYFWIFPLAIFGFFVWRYFRSGSVTGALLGGRITSTVGEIKLQSSGLSSSVLKVHILVTSADAHPQVALAVVSKADLS